ncbi:MAG: hypothetical protein JHC82_10990, partial [Stenotrophomonas sp.]|nr:hypothetical protein [Stenotrophomonas sp.]
MDIAHCTLDGGDYTAVRFQQLPPADLEAKRRNLTCVRCGQQAFFRKKAASGRAACFGARPHAPGCGMAADDHLRVEIGIGPDEAITNNTDVLVPLKPRKGWTSANDFEELSAKLKDKIETEVPSTFVSVSQPIEDLTNQLIAGS